MSFLRAAARPLRKLRRGFGALGGLLGQGRRLDLLEEQCRFILYELRRMNEAARRELAGGGPAFPEADARQTRSSFDYQWRDMPSGTALPDDRRFMEQVEQQICRMTDLPREWFPGKKVVDIGCGIGRFSYGLLSLGATVTACDQSEWALQRTVELCKPYADRLRTERIDLLSWSGEADYDLAFCFGVVHHTGDTYTAIANAARKVAPGGRLFLMVYGFPETLEDFRELNAYERLRWELRNLPMEEKRRILIERFGPKDAHGWFDAVSPRINDLLTFEEIEELLLRLGFEDVRRTVPNRNHHLVATRRDRAHDT